MFDKLVPKNAAIGEAYGRTHPANDGIMMQRMQGMWRCLDVRSVRLTSFFIGLLAVAGLAACKEDAGSAPAPQLPQVEVITVSTQSVPDEPEFIGEAEASRPVEIRSQVTGILKAVLYQEGRDVKKGDRLY